MSQRVTLKAEKRDAVGRGGAKRLRREGIVPAVVYGAEQRNYTIQISAKDFSDVLRHTTSENFLVTLEIEGANEKSKLAIVQDYQSDPLSGQIVHVDFHAVRENEEIHANLPIVLHGEPIGVKSGGLLEHQLHNLEVHCLPSKLPESLELDVTNLEVGAAAHVSDIKFPEGVHTSMNQDVVVAIVIASRAAVAAEATGGEAAATPAA